MPYVMGIDIGTTGAKTLLINEKGGVVGSAIGTYPIDMPRPGWAEQDPDSWWKATRKGIRQVLSTSCVHPSDIAGVGLTGQYHGAVLIDSSGQVLRPCIIWADQRTIEQSEKIKKIVGEERLLEITGSPGFPYFTLSKILWVRENEPSVFEKLHKFLLPKDYVRFKLTNNFVTDVTDASGTLLLDLKKRKWSGEMLEYLQLDVNILPDCLESVAVSGYVTKQAAKMTGLKEGTPVIAGAGDQAAQAVGNGVIEEGLVSSTIGTSGVVFAPTSQVKLDPLGRLDSFCHAVPQKWHVMGVMNCAGGALRWFRDNLGEKESLLAKEKEKDVYHILTEEASSVEPGSEGLIFLPYLIGERHPYADPYARGVFLGLSLRHKKSHLIRSVLEGVAYGLKDCLEVIKDLGVPVKEIVSSGGGAKSDLWIQIQADVNNLTMVRTEVTEGAAFGAAILATVETGIYDTIEEACREIIRVDEKFHPIKDNVAIYANFHRIYHSLYPVLKDTFAQINQIIE